MREGAMKTGELSKMIDATDFPSIATTIRWAFSKTAAAWYKAPHSPKLRDPPRRVSPRAFPKRFMNYVDRSWCGRSVCKPATRRTFLVARQNAVCRRWVWWMNPRHRLYSERGDTLSSRHSHHAVSSFIRGFRIIRIDYLPHWHARTFGNASIKLDHVCTQTIFYDFGLSYKS